MKLEQPVPHPLSSNTQHYTTILNVEVAQCIGPRGYWATIELPMDYWHSIGAYRFNFGGDDART